MHRNRIPQVFTLVHYYDITGAVKPAETGRVGDILRCNNALSAAGGCGTHEYNKIEKPNWKFNILR